MDRYVLYAGKYGRLGVTESLYLHVKYLQLQLVHVVNMNYFI
jgi:hypothetical protein